MAYSKQELLNLPVQEKQGLAEELWNSIDEGLLSVIDEEIAFVNERLKMHEANPQNGLNCLEFKNMIKEKYGFWYHC